MSILSAALPDWVVAGTWLMLLLLALGLMTQLGVFSPRRIAGPLRWPLYEPVMPLVLTMVIAGSVWFGVYVIYNTLRQAGAHGQPTQDITPTPAAYALLSTLPGILGFWALWVGNRFAGMQVRRRLGFDSAGLRRGVRMGLLGILIVWPLVFWIMALSEWVYRHFAYQHQMEHDLLKNLVESHNRTIQTALVIGAAIIAPFFEEYFFRAHLQTVLKRAFIALSQLGRRTAVGPRMLAGTSPLPPLPPFPPPRTPYPPEPEHYASDVAPQVAAQAPQATPEPPGPTATLDRPGIDRPLFAWQSWLAVLISSGLFASIHDAWSIPGIFILALGLGYVYERTGNLWACITMHLIFNSISTFFFLYFVPHAV